MKINNQHRPALAMAVVLLVANVSGCGIGDQTDQARRLITEGNAAVEEARKYLGQAEAKRQKMLQTELAKLEEARVAADEAIATYEEARKKCIEASAKFGEAGKLKVKDKLREYLSLKMQEHAKRAELVQTAKGTPRALIDSPNEASFVSLANANNVKVDRLAQEANDLAAQADKLQKDHPDILK